MGLGIADFSRFVIDMNQRALLEDAEELARWAVYDLSRMIGFDAAWYGWAHLHADCIEVYANATLSLPDDYYINWQYMANQDLLARSVIENPQFVAQYDRRQRHQTDGMVDLADRYGLTRMATAVNGEHGAFTKFFLSSYRFGANTRQWSVEECDFLKYAVDHLSSAMKLSSSEPGRAVNPASVTILASENGVGLLGLEALREQFGEVWPRWTGDALPEQLARLAGLPGQHILPDRDLSVTVELTPLFQGMGLRHIKLRRLNRFDLLTARERQVALQLAAGRSAKEVARSLGIAPATVRNQTQSIYHKLQVDNRATLASMVNAPTVG